MLSISPARLTFTPQKLASCNKDGLNSSVFLSMQKGSRGRGEDMCKACFQNSFPCKFISIVFSICFQRMSDNKLPFHLLFWKADLVLGPHHVSTHLSQQSWPIIPAEQTKQAEIRSNKFPLFKLISNEICGCLKNSRHPIPSASRKRLLPNAWRRIDVIKSLPTHSFLSWTVISQMQTGKQHAAS